MRDVWPVAPGRLQRLALLRPDRLAAALGSFLFHEMVEPAVLVGGAIVLAAIVLLLRHEHAVALQARQS